MPIWHIKERPGRSAVPPVRLHRTRRHHGRQCAQNSERAIEVSVYVVRAFLKLKEMLKGNKELARRMDELERKLATHDSAILEIVEKKFS